MRYFGPPAVLVRWMVLATCTALALVSLARAGGNESLVNKSADDIAIDGYDTVAYFTEDRAVKGDQAYAFEWHGARWHFSNIKHRELFAADPERYLPQFGGLCAGAVRRGVVVKADPEAWTIVDGKLYMKVNKTARDEWRQNASGNIQQANKAWAELVEKN